MKVRFVYLFVASAILLMIGSSVHIKLGKSSLSALNEEGTSVDVNEKKLIPKDLSEAIEELDSSLDEEEKIKMLHYSTSDFKELSYEEYMEATLYGHLGVGMSIRNVWGLWEDSRLKRWFLWRGVRHPDDVSGVILKEYISQLEGKPVRSLFLERALVLAVLSLLVSSLIYGILLITRRIVKSRGYSSSCGIPSEN